jgi:putative hemolysin
MIFEFLLLIILILINGIFSASEIAFLSVDKIDLKEKIKKGDKRAKEINKILEDTNKFLATIQVVITFAGFLASAFAANTFVNEFMSKINYNANYKALIENVLVVLVTMILSYLTLIF